MKTEIGIILGTTISSAALVGIENIIYVTEISTVVKRRIMEEILNTSYTALRRMEYMFFTKAINRILERR